MSDRRRSSISPSALQVRTSGGVISRKLTSEEAISVDVESLERGAPAAAAGRARGRAPTKAPDGRVATAHIVWPTTVPTPPTTFATAAVTGTATVATTAGTAVATPQNAARGDLTHPRGQPGDRAAPPESTPPAMLPNVASALPTMLDVSLTLRPSND